MKNITTLSAMLLAGSLFAQNEVQIKHAESIKATDLKKHLEVLASDEYEGRETGKKGQKMAAKYIAEHFKGLGIASGSGDTSYMQPFSVLFHEPGGADITWDESKFSFQNDFFYMGSYPEEVIDISEVAFVGYGIEDENYNDYNGASVKGKAVIFYDGEPESKKGESVVSGSLTSSEWVTDRFKKIKHAQEKGASCVFTVLPDYDQKFARYKTFLLRTRTTLKSDLVDKDRDIIPNFYISSKMAERMLGMSEKKVNKLLSKAASKGTFNAAAVVGKGAITMKPSVTEGKSENVLGYIEGTDLKDELLVISGHYDHLGMEGDKIFNGADDDGSGTVSVLELAEAFKLAKDAGNGPRRSVLFMLVSGEEKGLLGSQYYTDNPIYKLENTVCNLNIDMVGRVDKKHKDNPNYIYIIGSDKLSSDLHKISGEANDKYTKLEMDYEYNDPKDPNRYYYRSDHYNFAKNNIPVIFYFNGTHEDYHKETDTVDKINFEKQEGIVKLVFHTAWEVANRDKRLKVDMENDFK